MPRAASAPPTSRSMLAQPPSPERITASRVARRPSARQLDERQVGDVGGQRGGAGAVAPCLAQTSSAAPASAPAREPCPTRERHQLAAADARHESASVERTPCRRRLAARSRARPARRGREQTPLPSRVARRQAVSLQNGRRTARSGQNPRRSRRGTCSVGACASAAYASVAPDAHADQVRHAVARQRELLLRELRQRLELARRVGRTAPSSRRDAPQRSAPCRSRARARRASASARAISTIAACRQPPSPGQEQHDLRGRGVSRARRSHRAEAAEREALAGSARRRPRRREREQQRRRARASLRDHARDAARDQRRDVAQREGQREAAAARPGSAAPRPDRTCP